MNLNQLQPKTVRKSGKRVGRGGKRGTYSGKGMKGQKSRAGAGFKPGFRGGDNRLWQLFPKQRGASKKPGSNRVHVKHRYFQLRHDKIKVLNLDFFNQFEEGREVTPDLLAEEDVKILGGGELKKKLQFKGFQFSKSAREKILKSGSKIN